MYCILGFLFCLSCAPWGSCFVCHVHLGVLGLFVMCTLGFMFCLSCAPWGSCFVCHVHLGVLVLFVMCTLGFMFCLSCAPWGSCFVCHVHLAQGHNAVTPVRLEPAALQSRVKHSTTEPLRSLHYFLRNVAKFLECTVSWGSCFVCHVHLGVLVLFVMCTLGLLVCLSCAPWGSCFVCHVHVSHLLIQLSLT